MPLSLNEIRKRAVAFSKEWENESREDAEAKSFWDGFFHVFGISRRRVAMFEQQVKKLDHKQGYIDLLWKGRLLIEHKSRGKDLERAFAQARDYFPGLKDEELPRYILVCDFYNFRLYDLDEGKDYSFTLNKLADNIRLFDFISGHVHHRVREQDPVNIAAAEMMGKLHDKLKEAGYEGHQLELYLVRLVFCLFADDTNIFEPTIFYDFLDQRTAEDGSDLAGWLSQLFDVLDTPPEKRMKNLDETLAEFPYVNGKLFDEPIRPAAFDSDMRRMLIQCCALDWSAISPAIFGSLFQSVMNPKERRNLGAHYTSEENILKLIKPLFLDELYEEFNKVKTGGGAKLDRFHAKLADLRMLDPACGCGNFLIVAYRELRLLEIEVLKAKFKNQIATNIEVYINVNVDQFYGIEYEEFPAQIAQVAMWLIDHQMNQLVSEAFGEYYRRLPLKKSATIVHGNALRTDWHSLLPEGKQYDYILGNPPFIGAKFMTNDQREDMNIVMHDVLSAGLLDYVTAWYVKATHYIQTKTTKVAFVSTNSITQGEQVFPLWSYLLQKKIKIRFAYRTFVWDNEAKGRAAVHCVIIGFNTSEPHQKILYSKTNGTFVGNEVKNINAYLINAKDILIANRNKPICRVPEIATGNKPIDGGHFIFSEEEKLIFLKEEPGAFKYFLPFIGAEEFINGKQRWILFLRDANPNELKKLPQILARINAVKKVRESSKSIPTQKLAAYPTRFHTENMPDNDFLVIPEVSSERRKYIPIGYLHPPIVCSNKLRIIQNATLYHFGVLSSDMHMGWTKTITGRLKSDFQYSVSIVYNNYPWPENPTEQQIKRVEEAAQGVLDARALYPNASLADLYDPNTMPPPLVKAHQKLDKAVDLCYRPQPFPDETRRIEFLFELYEKYTAGLFGERKAKGRRS